MYNSAHRIYLRQMRTHVLIHMEFLDEIHKVDSLVVARLIKTISAFLSEPLSWLEFAEGLTTFYSIHFATSHPISLISTFKLFSHLRLCSQRNSHLLTKFCTHL